MPQRSAGFTLIEMMIVVAAIAILAAIAYPSYQEQIRKSRRAAAQGVLLDIASRQQQVFLDARSYTDLAGTAAAVPAEVSAAYVIDTQPSAGTPPGFAATATPVAGSAQAADRCGTLSINQAGQKSASAGGVAVSGCW